MSKLTRAQQDRLKAKVSKLANWSCLLMMLLAVAGCSAWPFLFDGYVGRGDVFVYCWFIVLSPPFICAILSGIFLKLAGYTPTKTEKELMEQQEQQDQTMHYKHDYNAPNAGSSPNDPRVWTSGWSSGEFVSRTGRCEYLND